MPVDPHALSKLRSWADLPFLAVNDGSGNRGWEWQQHILPHFKIFKLTRIWERWFLDISCWTELLRSCVWNEAQSRSPRISWLWSKFGSKHPIWEEQWSQVHAALVWIQYQPEIITGTGSNLGEHVKRFYDWLKYASQNMTSMQDPLISSNHLCRWCQMMPYLLAISLLGSVALKSSKGPGNLHRTRLGDVLRPCCQLCWSLSVQYIPSKLFTSGYAYTRTLSWVLLSGSKAQPFLSWTCLGHFGPTLQNSSKLCSRACNAAFNPTSSQLQRQRRIAWIHLHLPARRIWAKPTTSHVIRNAATSSAPRICFCYHPNSWFSCAEKGTTMPGIRTQPPDLAFAKHILFQLK